MKVDFFVTGTAYRTPGTIKQVIASFEKHPLVAELVKVQVAYYQGDIDSAYRMAKDILPECSTFEEKIGVHFMLGVCAMYRGNINLWRMSRKALSEIACANEDERVKCAFWLAAYDSSIYDNASWPEWFRKGRLSVLPQEYEPLARVYYIKHLLVQGYDTIRKGEIKEKEALKYLILTLPIACEPLIAQTQREGAIISEISLRLLCAVSYHNANNNSEAIYHIDKAIALALPDKIYAPLAENRSPLDTLLDERLKKIDVSISREVKRLADQLLNGWRILHNNALDRDYSGVLTAREREASRLAVYGLSNDEIAARLDVSLPTAKDYIQKALEKTGANKRAELVRYI